MGTEAAARDAARDTTQSTTTTASTQPGKANLAQQLPTADAEMIERIKRSAGKPLDDGANFNYVAAADGTFECVSAPAGYEGAVHQHVTPDKYRNSWLVLGGKLVEKYPEPKPNTEPTKQPAPDNPSVESKPRTDAVKPIVEPSLVARASEVLREELGAVTSGASSLWSRVVNALGGGDAPATAPVTTATTSTTAPPTPTSANTAPPAAPAASSAPAAPLPVSTDIPAHFRAKESWSQDPLEAGLSRTTGELAGKTSYTTKGTGLYGEMAAGKADQKRFFCDGFQIWALAASGYNMLAPIVAADGVAIQGQKYTHDGEKRVADGKPYTPCLYDLINGDDRAVETVMAAGDMKKGGVFEIHGTGFLTQHEGTEMPLAMRGAPGAFAVTGLGSEVAEVDQVPGDFVQARWPTTTATDSTSKQRGDGHAWIVNDVYANGSAWFGATASPKQCSGGQMTGWNTGVDFIIEKDTDPRLVGAHTAIAAQRCEANVRRGTDNKNLPGVDDDKNGGAQVTGFHPLAEKGEPGTVRFVGRLGTSRWHGWKQATPETARIAALFGPETPTPLPATPNTDAPNADAPEADARSGETA